MPIVKDCYCTVAQKCPLCSMEAAPNEKFTQMETEETTKPRLFSPRRDSMTASPVQITDDLSDDGDMPDPLALMRQRQYGMRKSRMVDDSQFLEGNRGSLRKFEALTIGDKTLTEMSIGGYQVDLVKAAEKTMEVIPLPASKLPVIFCEQELNFYHHFFQAMSQKIGESVFLPIVTAEYHYAEDAPVVSELINDMIESGYTKADTELMKFLKKVITSTFESAGFKRSKRESDSMTCVANLWGFQYLETGMQCNESELRMWLAMCYSHYRTRWFNAFKSTGVPAFAMHGAQKRKSTTSSTSSSASILELMPIAEDDGDKQTSYSRRSRRRGPTSHKGSRREQLVNPNAQITKWFASTR